MWVFHSASGEDFRCGTTTFVITNYSIYIYITVEPLTVSPLTLQCTTIVCLVIEGLLTVVPQTMGPFSVRQPIVYPLSVGPLNLEQFTLGPSSDI